MKSNPEHEGDTCLSVREVLRQGHAHCIEGAFVAAAALWINGYPPLLVDMKAHGDDDHVLAVFRRGAFWGAISKSNHIWLRWRDPIYRSLRELMMSYFHEYVKGERKTLRSYSRPFDMRKHDPALWITNPDSCWDVAADLDSLPHVRVITPAQVKKLLPRDKFEVAAGKILEYP
jgi:hypothetical protein